MAIRLHTHLKQMIVKASTMQMSIGDVHRRIDKILEEYGVKNKLPINYNKSLEADHQNHVAPVK